MFAHVIGVESEVIARNRLFEIGYHSAAVYELAIDVFNRNAVVRKVVFKAVKTRFFRGKRGAVKLRPMHIAIFFIVGFKRCVRKLFFGVHVRSNAYVREHIVVARM